MAGFAGADSRFTSARGCAIFHRGMVALIRNRIMTSANSFKTQKGQIKMPKLCTYLITNDTGLAPNPYWGWCTLAVCTPNHQGASLDNGDWIAGFLTKSRGHRLVYAMEVMEQMDLNYYYHDSRFAKKRPNLRGSWKERCGDNFYSRNEDGTWKQHRNCFHIGDDALRKDTRKSNVFIARKFWYFGRDAMLLPSALRPLVGGRGIRVNHSDHHTAAFRKWMESIDKGIHALPNDNPDFASKQQKESP